MLVVMEMIGIYIIKNKLNGNSYIGKSNNIKRRFTEHRSINHETNKSLKLAYKKYGLDNFSFEILEECKLEELNDKERYYIDKLKPKYNRTDGGDGAPGHSLSEQTKALLREKGKEVWENLSLEQKNNVIANNLTGPKKGHEVSKETREKLRNANLGKKQTPETIQKRKETIKNSGYIRTNENHKKAVRCVETGEIFESVKDAMQKYNLTTLVGHLKGRYKTCKGNHYEYL